MSGKLLSYDKQVLIGRDAVAADLRNTLSKVHLEFVGNQVESLIIEKDTAVEQTLFTIKATPIAGGEPLSSKAARWSSSVRYKPSPTGWASIREIIQPAT